MKRKVVSSYQDKNGNGWITELDCFHNHTIPHPSIVHSELECTKCNALSFPEGLMPYKRTPEFTEQTIPKALLNHHATKVGTWGKIHVLAGLLIYSPQGADSIEIRSGDSANVPPQMLHAVKAKNSVRFYVEFYKLHSTD